jgi:hypothetical protein
MNKAKGESQEDRINKGISLRPEKFSSSKGIFSFVYEGKITEIVRRFNAIASQGDPSNDMGIRESKNDIL